MSENGKIRARFKNMFRGEKSKANACALCEGAKEMVIKDGVIVTFGMVNKKAMKK